MNKNLPTDFLRSLVVIADMDSFTKAGEMLGRSQSAVSLQMKKLEQLVGQSLFERQGHNFSFTPQGELLLNYARQMLELNDQALNELNPQAFTGNIRLGLPSEFATRLLPRMLGTFTRNHPQVTLEVQCDLSRNLRRDFSKDCYDIIVGLKLLESESEKNGCLRCDDLVWVGSPHFKWREGVEVPLIVAHQGCLYREQAIASLDQAGIPWRIVYTIMEIAGIEAALRAGIGITVLSRSSVPDGLPILNIENLPDMSLLGIELKTRAGQSIPAMPLLSDYIKQALR